MFDWGWYKHEHLHLKIVWYVMLLGSSILRSIQTHNKYNLYLTLEMTFLRNTAIVKILAMKHAIIPLS